jgi:radical SAM protein (TIGR01212 family)
MTFFTYQDYLQRRFGKKVYKVALSILGASCPTRDGRLMRGGCAFCDAHGSGSFYSTKEKSRDIRTQLESKLPAIRARFGAQGFLAYLQSYTNTYGDRDQFRAIYEDLLSHPEVSGLNIGTRPDCLEEELLLDIEELAKKFQKPITIELGIQSLDDGVLNWLVRGHDGHCSIDAIQKIHRLAPSVEVSGHLIFGSPGEASTIGRDTALQLNSTQIQGVKLHQLMVLARTGLARIYAETPFEVPTIKRYAEIVGDFIDHLRPDIYIERLYAMASDKDECIAPKWSTERWASHNAIRDLLAKLGTRQGQKFQSSPSQTLPG